MLTQQPHRVTVDDIKDRVEKRYTTTVEATTVDGTQRKYLRVSSLGVCKVWRSYIPSLDSNVIYEGNDITEAVRLYNQLS